MFLWHRLRLRSRSAPARVRAIAAMSALDRQGRRDPRAVPLLLTALADGDASVRASAATHIAGFNDRRAFHGVLAALGDPAADVRCAAAYALPRLHGLIETSPLVRGPGVEALKARLEDTDEAVRKAASTGLQDIARSARALDALKGMLPGVLEAIVRADDRRA